MHCLNLWVIFMMNTRRTLMKVSIFNFDHKNKRHVFPPSFDDSEYSNRNMELCKKGAIHFYVYHVKFKQVCSNNGCLHCIM